MFYRISGPEKRYGILHLDQPRMRILGYYLTEKFHSRWFTLYFTLMLQKSNALIVPYLIMKYRGNKFTSYNNYTQLAKEMKDVLLVRRFMLYFKTAYERILSISCHLSLIFSFILLLYRFGCLYHFQLYLFSL